MSLTQKSESDLSSSLGREDKNHIPVIDRMLDILELIELRQSGIVIKDLCDRLSVPRSTVYRILNTLEARDVVKRAASGAYVLGPRLMNFAANVTDTRGSDLAQISMGPVEQLSLKINQSVKVSIVYNETALVVCCAQSTQDFAITVRPGRTIPLHAGAASKILLANLPEPDREKLLASPLRSFTSKTITDPGRLREELDEVRATDWSVDVGEHGEGIHAMATSIRGADGNVVAAISIPYLGTSAKGDLSVMRQSLIKTAQAISKELRRRSA
jgi:DNA-binding IclR family transcriptional regulator